MIDFNQQRLGVTIMKYAFITKTKHGYVLAVRSDFDYSTGEAITTCLYHSKVEAKRAAKVAGAKAWNY
jgi:hypothetical protein